MAQLSDGDYSLRADKYVIFRHYRNRYFPGDLPADAGEPGGAALEKGAGKAALGTGAV